MKNRIVDVDEYIVSVPEKYRDKLKQMRKVIKEVAPPSTEEKISYGMPYYGYKGRLAYFALSKKHIGLYIPPPIIEKHSKELKKYETAKSTVRFPLNEDLPIKLVKKLIRARVKWNEKYS